MTVRRRWLAVVFAFVIAAAGCSAAPDSVATADQPTSEPERTPAENTNQVPAPTPPEAEPAEPEPAPDDPTPAPPATATSDPEPAPANDPDPVRTAYEPLDCDVFGDSFTPLDVVNVDPDDPDGGLIVHVSPGADTPEVGILPWNTRELYPGDPIGSCARAADGGTWVAVTTGALSGWVNAFFIGEAPVPDGDLDDVPCSPEEVDPSPAAAEGKPSDQLRVTRITTVTTDECDRVVIELADSSDDASLTTTLASLPAGTLIETLRTTASVELALRTDERAGEHAPFFPETWRDAATGEWNAVSVFDRPAGDGAPLYHVRADWGSGDAAVRYLDNPARIVIDIVQSPTPPGKIVGPVVGSGTIIFDPLQTDAIDGMASEPFTVRGFSRGFEAQSLLQVTEWDGTDAVEITPPTDANFGVAEFVGGPPPIGLTIEPDPQFVDPATGTSFFTTQGWFEFSIGDLEPGAWQLRISGDTGCGFPTGPVFRFHVGEPGPADAFGIAVDLAQTDDGEPVTQYVRQGPSGDSVFATHSGHGC